MLKSDFQETCMYGALGNSNAETIVEPSAFIIFFARHVWMK